MTIGKLAGKPDKRKLAEKKGRNAESLATWWLRLQGYKILARREKTPKGEIDIIACRGKTIVFIEVKARSSFTLGVQSITPRQIRRIISAAQYWLATRKNQQNYSCRFDIMLIKPYLLIKHIKNAFDETGRPL